MGWLPLKFLTFLCQILEVALFIEKINEKFTLAGSLAGRITWVDKMIYPGG